jgi:hypothetical protein
VLLDGSLVKRRRIPFFERNRAERTMPQARAKTVAQVVANQTGLAIDDLDGSLGAIWHALTASIAEIFVNVDHHTRLSHA